jgi:hypothetical protein
MDTNEENKQMMEFANKYKKNNTKIMFKNEIKNIKELPCDTYFLVID